MLFPGQLDQILILDTIIYILQNLLKKRSRGSLKIFAKKIIVNIKLILKLAVKPF